MLPSYYLLKLPHNSYLTDHYKMYASSRHILLRDNTTTALLLGQPWIGWAGSVGVGDGAQVV